MQSTFQHITYYETTLYVFHSFVEESESASIAKVTYRISNRDLLRNAAKMQ
jgi:hypothetical protein